MKLKEIENEILTFAFENDLLLQNILEIKKILKTYFKRKYKKKKYFLLKLKNTIDKLKKLKKFKNKIKIEINQDPEIIDEYLKVTIRSIKYDNNFLQIVDNLNEDLNLIDIIVTTDFKII